MSSQATKAVVEEVMSTTDAIELISIIANKVAAKDRFNGWNEDLAWRFILEETSYDTPDAILQGIADRVEKVLSN